MTEPRGPIDWARQQAAEREQQPARKLLDQMSDRELVELYGERDLTLHLLRNVRQTCAAALNRAEQAERVAQSAARDTAKALADYLAAEQRAEQAEAAIGRVSAVIAAADWPHAQVYARDIRAALAESKEPRP